nr:ABC transporter ATP-binding protein [Croceicoccus marinus]
MACGALAAILEGIGIGLIIPLLSVMTGSPQIGGGGQLQELLIALADFVSPTQQTLVIAGAILALITFKNLVGFLGAAINSAIYRRSGHLVRTAVAGKITRLPYSDLLAFQPSRLLNIISRETWATTEAIQARIAIATRILVAGIFLAFLVALSWQMTLAVGAGVIIIQLVHRLLSRTLHSGSSVIARENASLASRMLHLIHGGQLIRLYGRQNAEVHDFERLSDRIGQLIFRQDLRKAVLGPMTDVLQSILFLAIILGAYAMGMSIPVIAAYAVLLYRLQPQVRGVQESDAQVKALSGSLDEVNWILSADEEATTELRPPSTEAVPPASEISLNNVSVSYPGQEDSFALRELDALIIRGRPIAVVGRSGSGKTTLINLLCRLISAQTGEIYYGDTPLSDIDLIAWRKRISVVSQDVELVEGSICHNVASGAPEATREDIEKALIDADAIDFVRALPKGMDSHVSYRATNLSLGQRARIALARGLVRQPEILILDEATNGLDLISAESILTVIRNISRDRFVIVVSHQPDTISFCEDVIVLENGEKKFAGARNASNREELMTMLQTQNGS